MAQPGVDVELQAEVELQVELGFGVEFGCGLGHGFELNLGVGSEPECGFDFEHELACEKSMLLCSELRHEKEHA